LVLRALQLPALYGISCVDAHGEEAFLERAATAFASGLRLVQVREKAWPRERLVAFAPRMLGLARTHGAKVLLNGAEDDARSLGFYGVHWTSARLASAPARPDDLMVGASCHDPDELARAAALGCDFAVLGPVLPTPSHPGARTLGWEGFARAIDGARLPVYALGGLNARDRDTAIDLGAHGVAMQRGAWEK
jgi:8-oxo-dGTP diphosphatase